MAEDGMVEGEVTRTTACRARACSGETEDRAKADSMLRACLAEAAAVLRLERAFELLQVHYRCCMLPRCLHASNGRRRES